MSDLLLELLSEEIPARMQANAAEELRKRVLAELKDAGLPHGAAATYVTPRRLCLHVRDIPEAQPDRKEERRGPRVDAPEKAIAGFLRATGIARDACETRTLPKGTFLFAVIEQKGQQTADILAAALPEVLENFPWPKSMRWGDGPSRWVRPLTSILCLLDQEVVGFQFAGVTSGRSTVGHRFHAPARFDVSGFDNYREKLSAAYVEIDALARRADILQQAQKLARDAGYHIHEDAGLLDEVAGLVERPIVLAGHIDRDFMTLPEEVLILSMRAHQRYMALRDAKGDLAPAFLVAANLATEDGGATIIAGNERVLKARLSDAKFFYEQDQKTSLIQRAEGLSQVVFQRQLGTLADKAQRLRGLGQAIADDLPECPPEQVDRAAAIAKADLLSEMVGEFPELQGIMGRYYALHDGEAEAVAEAIAAHYRPAGPDDAVPAEPVSMALALADKFDTLVGFFAIDQRPTGSKDPYALRRAALGIIRIILDNGLRLPLRPILATAYRQYAASVADLQPETEVLDGLMQFIADRLKVHLRSEGVRHDHIDAVYALGDEDDLVRLVARVQALASFLNSEDGENLLTGYRRAVNIVRIEEKKDKIRYAAAVAPDSLVEPAETRLFQALDSSRQAHEAAIVSEDFSAVMGIMAKLRAPIDGFFNDVTVNDSDPGLRRNRLYLLSHIRTVMNQVADFSCIEG